MTAIIILNYNSSTDTINCIGSIEKFNSAPVKYIVVDNGSSDPCAVSAIEEYLISTGKDHILLEEDSAQPSELPYFTIISSKTNDGYACGNNKGLQYAYSDKSIDNIMILNNDTLFIEDIIPKLLEQHSVHNDCAFITPLLLSKDGSIDYTCARSISSNWDIIIPFLLFKRDIFNCLSKIRFKNKILLQNPDLLDSPSFPIYMPSGSCMLVKKEMMAKIGGFDPSTFLYYEENILAKKVESLDLKNYCVPSVKVIHLGARSTRQSPSDFLQRCNLESADYYMKSFCDLTLLQKLLWTICKWTWRLKWSLLNKS